MLQRKKLSDFTKFVHASLILLFFAHLSMHHILIRVYYVLGTVTGTLDKAINKTWFLTMEKIKMRDQEERLTQK